MGLYGLSDASRRWYLRVAEELAGFGVHKSMHDQAIFSWYSEGKLNGIIAAHVNDFFWEGSTLFELHVINKIKEIFKISHQDRLVFHT